MVIPLLANQDLTPVLICMHHDGIRKSLFLYHHKFTLFHENLLTDKPNVASLV